MPNVEELIKRMDRFENDRSNWDSQYQDCADYAMPQNNQITRKKAKGEPGEDLFDTTAEESLIQLSAGLYSYMFPTDGRAFVLEIDDDELSQNDDVKQWLEKTTKVLHKFLVSSNFRQEFFGFLKQLCCFGTACLYEEKGKKTPIVFRNFHISGVYIATNSDGIVDTVFRTFEYTARQAVQEFGKDNLGTKINTAYDNIKNRDKKFKFIHAVYPREEYDPEKDDPVNMPFASVYISRDEKLIIKTKDGLDESGYPELPYQVDRFDRDAQEEYGRSPTMKKLPDAKMACAMKKTRIKGWEKQVDPPALLPDDGSIWPLATQPGGVVFYRAGGDKPEYWEFKGNLQEMEKAILSVQQDIQRGYFIDMFDPLIDRQNMTATEVMARVEQKMRFLTPIIGRLQSELFNPMILRMIGILSKQKKLPKMPAELSEQEFSVMYLGRLALALRTLESEGLAQLLLEWAPMAEVSDFMDNLDTDTAFRDSARNRGVPATWLKAVEKRDADRLARQQAAQQQALMEQIPDFAKAAKAGGTKPEEGSLTQGVLDAAA
jgi:hypothetical protein